MSGGLLGWLAAGALAQAPPDDDFEIVVIGRSEDADPASTTLGAEEAARVPGVQGDAIKAVQTVAGVARPPIGGDGLVIWGAAPGTTRAYVDDIPVPRLFHRGGLRSIVPSAAVATLRVVPGAPEARYGRGLGGVVAVTTRPPAEARLAASVHADPIDVGGRLQVRAGTVAVAAGGRVGVLRRLTDRFVPVDVQALLPIPDTGDYLGTVTHTTDDLTLTLTAFGSTDRTDRGIPGLTPDAGFTERTVATFHRVGLRLERTPRARWRTTVLLWGGRDRDDLDLDFRDVTAAEARSATRLGALLVHARRRGRLTMRAGLDAEVAATRIRRDGAASLPAREGDVRVFGQPPGNRVNLDDWSTRQLGLGGFASARLDLGALWLQPGVRLEPLLTDGSRILPVRPTEPPVGFTDLRVVADPRIRARLRLVPGVWVVAAGGRVHQLPDPADLSPIFGNPRLEPAVAWHGTAGLRVRPSAGFRAEVVGFAVRQARLAMRAPEASPALASALASVGTGRSLGVQASVRAAAEPVLATLAVTWQRNQRREGPGEAGRRFDLDQPLTLQAAASWRPAPFEVGLRLEVASGFPRTPVVGANFDARQQAFDPLFGSQNAARLPTFASLSARVAWVRRLRAARVRLWLDVINATNRANVEEWFFSADYRQRGDIRGLPVLPVLGGEVAW